MIEKILLLNYIDKIKTKIEQDELSKQDILNILYNLTSLNNLEDENQIKEYLTLGWYIKEILKIKM
jgi:hypothetical protein